MQDDLSSLCSDSIIGPNSYLVEYQVSTINNIDPYETIRLPVKLPSIGDLTSMVEDEDEDEDEEEEN